MFVQKSLSVSSVKVSINPNCKLSPDLRKYDTSGNFREYSTGIHHTSARLRSSYLYLPEGEVH